MPAACDNERAIHALVLQKDDLAFSKLCDDYFEPVLKRVTTFNKSYTTEDDTLIMDVVTDAFMNYFKNPSRYQPDKSGLVAFLVMDIEGDLLNAREKIKRQQKKVANSVALDAKNGKSYLEDKDLNAMERLINHETEALLDRQLKQLFPDEKDVQAAHLMLAGERRSSEYIRLLEIESLNHESQAIEIKRLKDRIGKTIKRKFRKP